MFKKRKKIELLENGFNYKRKFYEYKIVKNIFFTIINTTHKVNFVKQGETMNSELRIILDSGKRLNIRIDELGYIFNTNKKKEIRSLVNVYEEILTKTYKIRKDKYLKELNINHYFSYDECKFYPNENKVKFRKKEFYLKEFYLQINRGYVVIEKRNSKTLDKIKRAFSLTKIPQFNTQTDNDIITELLKDYFGITLWQ